MAKSGSPSCRQKRKKYQVKHRVLDTDNFRPIVQNRPASVQRVVEKSAKEKPAARNAAGHIQAAKPFAQPVEPSARIVSAFDQVAQLRFAVGFIERVFTDIKAARARGGRSYYETHVEGLKIPYRAALGAYLAAPAIMPETEEYFKILGIGEKELRTALEGVGWFIAAPAERARIGSSRRFVLSIDGVRAHG